MINSILNSTKKQLGLAEDYDEFDQDVLVNINSAFSTLQQLGVGPEAGFYIEDDVAEWGEFLPANSTILNMVRTYVFTKVKIAFDPPDVGFHLNSLNEQLREMEWRLEVMANPAPPVVRPVLVVDES